MKQHIHDEGAAAPDAELSLAEIARGWDRFWFAPLDPTALAFIRICTGVVILYVHLCYSFGLLAYVGREGWIYTGTDGPRDAQAGHFLLKQEPMYSPGEGWDENPRPYAWGRYNWSIFFHVENPTWVWVIHLGILTSMFLFTIGLWTRQTAVLSWLGAMMYIQRAASTLFGMDAMMMILLLYLMIGPCGAALSVDRWLERRRARHEQGVELPDAEPSVTANFATRLIQVHFCIIYIAAGTSKLLGSTWWSGTAPSMVLLNYSFAPFYLSWWPRLMVWLTQNRTLWELMCSGGVLFTLVTELGLPFLIWNRWTRWVMICCSALLHTAIGLTMGLTTFSLLMLAMLLAFVPPQAVREVLDRLGGQARRLLVPRHRRTAAAAPSREPALVAGS